MHAIFLSILLGAVTSPAHAADAYSFVFQCGGQYDKEICLQGSRHEDDEFFLLPKTGNKPCRGRAGAQFLYDEGNLSFGATRTKSVKDCGLTDRYFFAMFERVYQNFANLELKSVQDEAADDIRTQIDHATVLNKILKDPEQHSHLKRSELSSRTEVSLLQNGVVKIYLASYEVQRTGRGPLVTSIMGRLQSLGGACSRPERAFRFDNDLYIIVGSYCCDCGWYERILYKYTGHSFQKVYANRDWPSY